MARRKRSKARTAEPRPVKPAEEASLYKGECVSHMDVPNNLVPLASHPGSPHKRFPLLSLRFANEDDRAGQDIFFDPQHGNPWDEAPNIRAPTWMDPHLFVEMCLELPEIEEILDRSFQKNQVVDMDELEAQLDSVLEEQYLVYVLENFELARPYVADWLIRHHCYRQTEQT